MTRFGFDEPNATIIGEFFTGKVFYDNRQQGRTIYADTEEELKSKALAFIQDQKNEHCGFPCFLFQENKWEIRIYN
jgi:hypothetical protein